VDKELLDEAFATVGAVIGGRGTYEAAGAWGGTNPWGVPMFVLTHRMQDAPPAESGFRFVSSFDEAIAASQRECSRQARVDHGRGGRDTQALRHGCVDELTISVAPVILGAGKRLFEGLDQTTALDQLDVKHSQWVTHLRYGVGSPTRADDRAPGSPLM
jgi:dihydrofolate reductase